MKRVATCLLMTLASIAVLASEPSVDDLFERARQLGFSGDRPEARALCAEILERSPDYTDVRTLMGRLYAWDKQYDEARSTLEEALRRDPQNLDARRALVDVELWDDRPEAARRVAEEGLIYHPENAEFLAGQARALDAMDRQTEALTAAIRALNADPESRQTVRLYRRMLERTQRNKISAGYELEMFDEDLDPWNAASVAYRRQSWWGSIIGRANFARRFGETGSQVEVDAYPDIVENTYAYLNLGVSGGNLFPELRYGAEVFHNFPQGWEGSLGFRRLDFDTNDVTIYTGSVSKYVGDFWVSLRPQYVTKSSGRSLSGRLFVRRFINGRFEYVQLSAGGGVGSDNRLVAEPADLDTRSLRADYRRRLKHSLILIGGGGVRDEEVTSTIDRRSLFLQIGFEKLF